MLKRVVLSTLAHVSKAVRDVDGPSRSSHRGKRPEGKEAVDAEDDQVDVLDPLVEEDLAKLHHLKLASHSDLERRVLPLLGKESYLVIAAQDVPFLVFVEIF